MDETIYIHIEGYKMQMSTNRSPSVTVITKKGTDPNMEFLISDFTRMIRNGLEVNLSFSTDSLTDDSSQRAVALILTSLATEDQKKVAKLTREVRVILPITQHHPAQVIINFQAACNSAIRNKVPIEILIKNHRHNLILKVETEAISEFSWAEKLAAQVD